MLDEHLNMPKGSCTDTRVPNGSYETEHPTHLHAISESQVCPGDIVWKPLIGIPKPSPPTFVLNLHPPSAPYYPQIVQYPGQRLVPQYCIRHRDTTWIHSLFSIDVPVPTNRFPSSEGESRVHSIMRIGYQLRQQALALARASCLTTTEQTPWMTYAYISSHRN